MCPRCFAVDTWQVRHADIVALRDEVRLLAGELTVLAADGSAARIAFNGAARASITRLVEELRACTTAALTLGGQLQQAFLAEAGDAVDPRSLDVGQRDLALVSETKELVRRHDGLRPLAWHGRRVVQPLKSGLGGVLLRLWLRTFPTELQGAVVLMDDVALEVLSRHAWVLRDSMPVTSIVRTMLPRSAVLGVEVAASARLRDVVEVTLSVPGHAIALALPQGSPAADLFQRAAG